MTTKNIHDRLEAALEISKIGFWDYNEKSHKVFFSKASKAIIGFEDDNTFGNDIDDWNNRVHPDDKTLYVKDYQDHINGYKPYYRNKHRVKCKDGSYKWILDKGKIINDPKVDGYIHFVGTHTDITDDIKNESKMINALNIATKQNNRLKNFAHIVTHNLKQYSGNFENLLELYDDSNEEQEKQELIMHLKEVSSSLKTTILNLNQIVSVESKKEAVLKRININEYIQNTIILFDLMLSKANAKIENNIDTNLYIWYNPVYLESVFQNLISNAIKYKHPNRKPVITINSSINNNKTIITVEDNGVGIDLSKYGNDIFGLYKTFHSNTDSEGVGLYLIKNQIESYGGSITVESKVDIGTKFIIALKNKTLRTL